MVEEKQQDGEQAPEGGQDDFEIESLYLGLYPATQKVIPQLLSKGKKVNENKKSKGKVKISIAQQILSQIVESVLTPLMKTTQRHQISLYKC